MFKFSQHIAISTPDYDKAVKFYKDVLGFEVNREIADDSIELKADQNILCLDKSKKPGLTLELIVDDLEKAKAELIKRGCKILCWEGKGLPNVVEDPFGVQFNIWES